MKNLFLIFAFLLLSIGLKAEPIANGTIMGIVVDSKSGNPVEYASVAVFQGTSPINGTITDNFGKFSIPNIKHGTYIIKVSFIGYETLEIKDVVLDQNHKDLGKIKLEPAVEQIEEVEVTAKKNYVEYQIDKKIVNVSSSIQGDNGTAVDALENVPSVDVDIEGNVTLRGSSNFTVLVDGKPSSISADELLKQTPAALIDNIEIITNPGAKYDPEGTSGIINLVMKKQKYSGTSGAINLNAGSLGQRGGSANFTFKREKVNFNLGGFYFGRKMEMENINNRITYGADNNLSKFNKSEFDRKFQGGGINMGLDVNVSPKDVINFSVGGGLFGGSGDGTTNYKNWVSAKDEDAFVANSTTQFVRSNEISDNNNFWLNGNVGYTHNFEENNPMHKLQVYATFNSGQSEDNQTLNQLSSLNDDFASILEDKGHINNNNGDNWRSRINIDYTKPFSKVSKMEFGYQGDLVNQNSDYDYWDIKNGVESVNDDFTNDIFFKRYIHALYGSYSFEVKTIGIQLGLRGEYTDRLIECNSQDYSLKRFDYFPTIHLSKVFGEQKDWNMQFGYSKRINRPRERNLAPIPMYSDEYTRRVGNPDIDPEYTHNLEFNFQKNFDKAYLALETFYSHTDDKTEFVSWVEDDILMQTVKNISTNNSFGLEFTYNWDPVKWFGINGSFTWDRYFLTGEFNGKNMDRDGQSWRTKETFTFKPAKNTRIQFNMRYRGKNQTLISSNKGNLMTGIAVRQSFMNRRLSLSADVRDLLRTQKRESTTETPEYWLYSKNSRKAPTFTIGVSYRINNYKMRGPIEGGESGGDMGGGDMGGDFDM